MEPAEVVKNINQNVKGAENPAISWELMAFTWKRKSSGGTYWSLSHVTRTTIRNWDKTFSEARGSQSRSSMFKQQRQTGKLLEELMQRESKYSQVKWLLRSFNIEQSSNEWWKKLNWRTCSNMERKIRKLSECKV